MSKIELVRERDKGTEAQSKMKISNIELANIPDVHRDRRIWNAK